MNPLYSQYLTAKREYYRKIHVNNRNQMTSTDNDYINTATQQARQKFLVICNLISSHYESSIHSLINLKARLAGLLTIKTINFFDICGTTKTVYIWKN